MQYNKRKAKIFWKQYGTAVTYGVIFLAVMIATLVIALHNSERKVVKVDQERLATSRLVSAETTTPAEDGQDATTPADNTTPAGDAETTTAEPETTTEPETTAATDGQTFTVVNAQGYVNIYVDADVNSGLAGTLANGFQGEVLQYGKWMCKINYQGVVGWVETSYLEVQ